MSYIRGMVISFIFCAIFWGILAWSMHRDRSRYRNVIFLFLAIVFTVPFLLSFTFKASGTIAGILMLALFLFVLVLPVFLIANGVTMMRKEGRSLANLLSFGLGIATLIAEISGVFLIVFPYFYDGGYGKILAGVPLAIVFIVTTVTYGSFCFGLFALYTLFLQIIPGRRDFDYVIIHGAGLLDGNRVSKLLADRLDKAIMVYQKDPTPPILIPSGGKGSDETISEAEAMSKYLIEHGIPEDKILPEDKSMTTYENIRNSKNLIMSRGGENAYIALVTSNYHVYRALRYCRKVGLKCTGIGSHIAAYYWPSALIREFIAIHREKKHLIIFVLGWLISLLPFFALLAEQITA